MCVRHIKDRPGRRLRPVLIGSSAAAKPVHVSLASVFAALAADPTALTALWKHVPAGVCVYDAEARPLSSNELFTRIVGDAGNKGQSAAPLSELVRRALAGEENLDIDA